MGAARKSESSGVKAVKENGSYLKSYLLPLLAASAIAVSASSLCTQATEDVVKVFVENLEIYL